MKLVLGTAQFGLDYGITNKRGKVTRDDVCNILAKAKRSGISMLDTAVAYGDSETVLGECYVDVRGFDFISKVTIKPGSGLLLKSEVERSCHRLGTDRLYALMVHNADALLSDAAENYWAKIVKLKQEGKIKKIGVSVYSPEQASAILEKFEIDIIQIPCNLLDQRFIQTGLLKEFKLKNIEVHVRSIFLQGLLLSNYSELPAYFDPIQSCLNAIDNMSSVHQISKLDLIISFLKTLKDIDAVVFGVTCIEELNQLLHAVRATNTNTINNCDYAQFSISEESMINPVNWPKKSDLIVS